MASRKIENRAWCVWRARCCWTDGRPPKAAKPLAACCSGLEPYGLRLWRFESAGADRSGREDDPAQCARYHACHRRSNHRGDALVRLLVSVRQCEGTLSSGMGLLRAYRISDLVDSFPYDH